MKILIFNGALERRPGATSIKIANYFKTRLESLNSEVVVFELVNSGIPLFDVTLHAPKSAEMMNNLFCTADHHIWLTPLYHGGMTGVMKNCIDWLELSARGKRPYLTDKKIGLVCWADGTQAMQGINNMDAVAKSLRGWPLPYSVPISRNVLYDSNGNFSAKYTQKFDTMIKILMQDPFSPT